MKFSWRKIKKYNLLPVLWEKYNNDIFKELGYQIEKKPYFIFTRLPSVAGLCITVSDGSVVICLRKSKIKNHNFLKTVLIHEMIHQYQHELKLGLEHDDKFLEISNKIKNKIGMDVMCE
jgi:hypothetical protein